MSRSSIVLVEVGEEYMTLAWGSSQEPARVEFRVNKQEPAREVTLAGNVLKKKNLRAGDVVDIRLLPEGRLHSFTQPASFRPPLLLPSPSAMLELAEDSHTGVALVSFPAVNQAMHYQVDMLPLDFGDAQENDGWVVVSDCLKTPGVKKKNLFTKAQYSFRYRAALEGGLFTSFSLASLPSSFPLVHARNEVLSKAVSPQLLNLQGTLVDTVSKLSGKVFALYFSASWCGPCRQMTPKLVQFHQQMRTLGKEFEIVFVSLDRDSKSFYEYYTQHMPGFFAVPFEQNALRERLQNEHEITGVPSLKIMSFNTGKCVEPDALRYALDARTFDSWKAKM
ncbi:hypothetical protein BASA81_000367 [Batrachochytrium salamandrivorans]|nr:hypothetical protein BASA81_000367 [Batrachochytrium salamandrivorans]